jgi:hypothetical protein
MKRSRKLPADANRRAFAVVQEAIGEAPPNLKKDGTPKNPAAVALGKLGGAKGGKARAAKLTKKQRSAAARNAALARWRDDAR